MLSVRPLAEFQYSDFVNIWSELNNIKIEHARNGGEFKIVNDMNLSINPQLDSIEIELYNDYHSVVGLRIARRLNPKKEETIYKYFN